MADVFGNPYLPEFVRNQPKMFNPTVNPPVGGLPTKANQITSVQGFSGARQHATTLTPGSSEIVAEASSDMARVYITVVDSSGKQYVQGFDLVPVQEPKEITMDDLNATMNKVLARLDQLEKKGMTSDDQSGFRTSKQNKPSSINANSGSWSSQNGQRSYAGAVSDGGNESADEAGN